MADRIALLLLLATLFVQGCAATQESGEAYKTVTVDPQRNTDIAKRENARGVRLIKTEDYETAEKAFRKALSADLMYGPAHNNLGRVYYRKGRLYLAAWEFQYAIKLMPNHPEPRNNLGLVFEAVGKLDDAVDEYGKALAMEPDNPEVIGNLARARIRRGDDDHEVRKLLIDLVMKDNRPDWTEWARKSLGTMGEE